MVGHRRLQPRPNGFALFDNVCVHKVPKKIHGVISSFADIALKGKKGGGQQSGGLAAIIEKAKAEKRAKRFDECVGNIFHLFFHQYVENFHCKPDTIDDLFSGLKYLIYAREDR